MDLGESIVDLEDIVDLRESEECLVELMLSPRALTQRQHPTVLFLSCKNIAAYIK